MAVKARGDITLTAVVDIKKVTRYYLLQRSTIAQPSKPTTNPPEGSWQETEPSYTEGSTDRLYTCDLTEYCDESFSYSEVSLSSSYEAAKLAYNQSVAAGNAASDAAKVATNYLEIDDGLVIGDHTSSELGGNVLIDSDGVMFREGEDERASFEASKLELGKHLANGGVTIETDTRLAFGSGTKVSSNNADLSIGQWVDAGETTYTGALADGFYTSITDSYGASGMKGLGSKGLKVGTNTMTGDGTNVLQLYGAEGIKLDGGSLEDINIGGLHFLTFESSAFTTSKGVTQTINTASQTFFNKLSGKTIISISGCWTDQGYASDYLWYPISGPMMTDAGAYSASYGFYIRLRPSTHAIQIITSSAWTQYKYRLLVVYK